MARQLSRRVAIAVAGALLIGTLAAAPASAIVPPNGGGASSCVSKMTGYFPVGGWYNSPWTSGEWASAPDLRWDLCVALNSNGTISAWARLLSPSTQVYVEQFDRFTGTIDVSLQRCATKTSPTVAGADWDVPGYSTGTASGNWYLFPWIKTAGITKTTGSTYRAKVSGYGAVVPRNGGPYFSLTPSPYGPPPGQAPMTFYTTCMSM